MTRYDHSYTGILGKFLCLEGQNWGQWTAVTKTVPRTVVLLLRNCLCGKNCKIYAKKTEEHEVNLEGNFKHFPVDKGGRQK